MNATTNLLQPLTVAISTPPAMKKGGIFGMQLLLSLVVGTIVVALFLPLVKLIQSVSGGEGNGEGDG